MTLDDFLPHLKMATTEVATLAGKLHYNVMADCRDMFNRLGLAAVQFSGLVRFPFLMEDCRNMLNRLGLQAVQFSAQWENRYQTSPYL